MAFVGYSRDSRVPAWSTWISFLIFNFSFFVLILKSFFFKNILAPQVNSIIINMIKLIIEKQ